MFYFKAVLEAVFYLVPACLEAVDVTNCPLAERCGYALSSLLCVSWLANGTGKA